jgi:hypothetical protein
MTNLTTEKRKAKNLSPMDLLKQLRGLLSNSVERDAELKQMIENAGGGLAGTQYVYVAANGTDVENAAELQAAYDLAKTMSPSASNRITVIAAPGNYKFPSTFIMDTEYIDLVSLTGNADVIFDVDVSDPFILSNFTITNIVYALLIDADNIFVKGIQGKDVNSANWNIWWGELDYKYGINISNNLPNVVVENCIAGPFSFAADFTFGTQPVKTLSSTFINCKASYFSFGYMTITSGTFLNCEAITLGLYNGTDLFGAYGTASGYFENCKSDNSSFARGGIASGTFLNCVSTQSSFGFGFSGIASGTFRNCIVDSLSFGGTASGIFINCHSSGSGSFGQYVTASGTFINCTGGFDSFASDGTASGTFTNCVAKGYSFGYNQSASGTFINCIGDDFSFGAGNGLTISGSFHNCIGKLGSFGSGSFPITQVTGKLYYCRLTQGSFLTVSTGGITRLCIDGNNAQNNQG